MHPHQQHLSQGVPTENPFMQQIPLISKSQSCHQRRLPYSQLHNNHLQQQKLAFPSGAFPITEEEVQADADQFNKEVLAFNQAEHLSIEQSKTRTSTYSKASKDDNLMHAFVDEGKATFLNPVDRHLEDTSHLAPHLQFSSIENRSPLRSNQDSGKSPGVPEVSPMILDFLEDDNFFPSVEESAASKRIKSKTEFVKRDRAESDESHVEADLTGDAQAYLNSIYSNNNSIKFNKPTHSVSAPALP